MGDHWNSQIWIDVLVRFRWFHTISRIRIFLIFHHGHSWSRTVQVCKYRFRVEIWYRYQNHKKDCKLLFFLMIFINFYTTHMKVRVKKREIWIIATYFRYSRGGLGMISGLFLFRRIVWLKRVNYYMRLSSSFWASRRS